MFVVDLPVPKNCYECPMCDYEQGFCLLSELDPETSMNVADYSNVISRTHSYHFGPPDYDDIAKSLHISKEKVYDIIKHNGKHPNCPIREVNMNNCCCKPKESE